MTKLPSAAKSPLQPLSAIDRFHELSPADAERAARWMPLSQLTRLAKSEAPLSESIQLTIVRAVTTTGPGPHREAAIALAARPDLTAAVGLAVVKLTDRNIIRELAMNSKTPRQVLEFMLFDACEDPPVSMWVHPRLGDEWWDALPQERVDTLLKRPIALSVFEHPRCPPRLIRSAMETLEEIPVLNLLKNPRCPADLLRLHLLSPNIRTHMAIAANPATPEELLESLAGNYHADVRLAVANNPNLPKRLLGRLLYDLCPMPQIAATSRIYEAYDNLRLTDWVAHVFGYAGGRLVQFVSRAIVDGLDLTWLVIAGRILRVLYETNPSSMVAALHRLSESGSFQNLHHLGACARSSQFYVRLGQVLRLIGEDDALELLTGSPVSNIDFETLDNLLSSMFPILRQERSDMRSHRINSMQALLTYIQTAATKSVVQTDLAALELRQERYEPALTKLSGQTIIDDLRMVFPKTAATLNAWAKEMDNCLGSNGYALRAMFGHCTLFFLQDNAHRILYAGEIRRRDHIIEILGVRNSPVPARIRDATFAAFAAEGINPIPRHDVTRDGMRRAMIRGQVRAP